MPDISTPARILVIRFSSIGDIVLTTPVVRCLKNQLYGAEIHFLTKTVFEPVVRNNPNIDTCWLYDHNFSDLIPSLKSQQFDFVVDLHNNLRSQFVRRQLNCRSATFPKLNLQKWLLVNLRINMMPEVHIVDRYFRAVQSLGVHNDHTGLDYFIPEDENVTPDMLPASHRRAFVAVVIGGMHYTKIFPVHKVADVVNGLTLPVMLLGGKQDRERGNGIAELCGERVFNGCGIFSLNQSASLIRDAQVVLTNDTGLMHVAAAFRKPVVSVWGNTVPGFGMYPYIPDTPSTDQMVAEVSGLSCRPCSKIGHSRCPKNHFRCMNDIDTTAVIRFLNRYATEEHSGQ
jgi:ADP-heptose:LPS heptosyltransferase